MGYFTCSINLTRKGISTRFRFLFQFLNKISGYFVRQGNCNEASHKPESQSCLSIHHCHPLLRTYTRSEHGSDDLNRLSRVWTVYWNPLELVWHFSNQGSLRKEFFVSLKKVVDANASVSGATDTAMAISVNHPQDLMLGCVYIYGRWCRVNCPNFRYIRMVIWKMV